MLSAAALVFATATVCAALPAEPQLKWRELAAEDKHRCALRPPLRSSSGSGGQLCSYYTLPPSTALSFELVPAQLSPRSA